MRGYNDETQDRPGGWVPKSGKIIEIEFDTRLLNDLRRFAEEDGVNSVYQEIRNICWRYAQNRKRRETTMQNENRELSIYRKPQRSRDDENPVGR